MATYPIVKLLSVSTALIMKLIPVKENRSEIERGGIARHHPHGEHTRCAGQAGERSAPEPLPLQRSRGKTLMTHRSDLEWIDSTEPLDAIIAQVKDELPQQVPGVPREHR
jgi:CBS domain containing-hemolysin-like protein